MKKILSVFLTLLLFVSVLAPGCLAEDGSTENWTSVDPVDASMETMNAVTEIVVSSAVRPVADVQFGESHTAVLFEDGTVKTFQSIGWYEGAHDYGECATSGWKDIKEIACGAEVTYGLRKDGSIAYAGKPLYMGFDSGFYTETTRLPEAFKEKNYTDIATAPYAPFFALRKDGSVLVELDWGEYYTAARKWQNIADIEYFNNCLYGLQKNGTLLVLGDGISGSTKVSGAESLKKSGIVLNVVLKNGNLKNVRNLLKEPFRYDDTYDYLTESWPGIKDAAAVWEIPKLGEWSEKEIVCLSADGSLTAMKGCLDFKTEGWEQPLGLWSWRVMIPEGRYSTDDWTGYTGFTELKLIVGLFDGGECRLRCCTVAEEW